MIIIHKITFEDPNIYIYPDWRKECKLEYRDDWNVGSKTWKHVNCKECLKKREI